MDAPHRNESKALEIHIPKMARLLQSLYTRDNQVFISPFNVIHALLVYGHGLVDQKIARRFFESLGYPPDQIHTLFEEKLRILQTCTSEKEKLLIGASLWFQDPKLPEKQPAVQQYADFVSKHYWAQVMPEMSADAINRWVDEKTGHLIPKIVDRIDHNASVFLVSALYFCSAWKTPFDSHLTRELEFTTATGRVQQVLTMGHVEGNWFPYLENEGCEFRSLVVPYADPDTKQTSFEAVIILPHNVLCSREEWAPLLRETTRDPHEFREQHHKKKVKLFLPKFKAECSVRLLEPLRQLERHSSEQGGEHCPYGTDMLQPGWKVSDIVHKVVVDVNERGTEASAVTFMIIDECGRLLPDTSPIEFRVNRPFFFGIYSTRTHEYLFTGIVNEIPV